MNRPHDVTRALCLLLLAGCSSSTSDLGGGVPDAASVSSTTCEASVLGAICRGSLQPSMLGAGVRDIDTSAGGQGAHFYCYPERAASWNGRVLLHLVGTGDNPSVTKGFIEHACSLGFAGLAPMYENRRDARSAVPIRRATKRCVARSSTERTWLPTRSASTPQTPSCSA